MAKPPSMVNKELKIKVVSEQGFPGTGFFFLFYFIPTDLAKILGIKVPRAPSKSKILIMGGAKSP